MRTSEKLKNILCHHYARTLSKNLELSYNNVIFQVKTKCAGHALRHAKISVYEHLDGHVTLHYKGRDLQYTTHEKRMRAADIVNSKDVNQKVDEMIKHDGRSKGHTPKINHPWRRYNETKTAAKEHVAR